MKNGNEPALLIVSSILDATAVHTSVPVKEKMRNNANCCLETGSVSGIDRYIWFLKTNSLKDLNISDIRNGVAEFEDSSSG